SARQAAAEVERRVVAGDGHLPAPAPPAVPAVPAAGLSSASPSAPDLLIDAAARLDVARVGAILDEQFATGSFETVVDGWLLPALVELGEAWSQGRVSVAGEHLVAYAVQRRLAAAYEAAAHHTGGPRVIIGLPAGARHELGLLAFATAARRVGLTTAYVGANLPTADWAVAAGAHDAACAVLAVPREADLAGLRAVVAELRSAYPELTIAVGGDQQDLAPKECLRLGHDIGEAAAVLANALAR
ncbi:MAG: B12-binding domain-containing protein, partial [Micrococcales bacterium]|nr:B12-binding domain-containing protein [Micrococcales bacterium]